MVVVMADHADVGVVRLSRRAVKQLTRESIRADLEREGSLGGGHEPRGNERANGQHHQQYADEPSLSGRAEEAESHGETWGLAPQSTPAAAKPGRPTRPNSKNLTFLCHWKKCPAAIFSIPRLRSRRQKARLLPAAHRHHPLKGSSG